MKRVVGVVVGAVVVVACSTPEGTVTTPDTVATIPQITTTTTVPDEGPLTTIPAPTTTDGPTTTVASTAAPGRAAVGEALTISGSGGVEVTVTVEQVVDPAEPQGDLFGPDPGHRFVAVVLLVENSGTAGYEGSPLFAARLIDDQHQEHAIHLLGSSLDCVKFDEIRIAPGDQRRGCVIFEVPDGLTPARFQWTAQLVGSQTGEWDL